MEKWSLPQGWDWVELGGLCELFGGSTPRRNRSEYFGGEIVWITPSDLATDGLIKVVVDSKTKLTEDGLNSCSAKLLPEGTVLFSSRATIGKVAIAGVPLATNQGFANFVCSSRVINHYLAWGLRALTDDIKQLASSTTYLEVSKRKLRTFTIPIPYPGDPVRSLDTQRRIVARIETLFDELREARKLHEAVVADTERLMDAAMQDVFEQGQANNWPMKTVDEIIEDKPQYGTSQKASEEPNGLPVLRMGNIVDGKISFDDLKYIDLPSDEEDKYLLREGDILFNRTNSAELVGKTAVYPSDREAVFASYLIRIVADPGQANPHFIAAYINSPLGRRYIEKQRTRAIGQANVNATKLRNMPILVPSLSEQHRAVDYLQAVRSHVEELKTVQATSLVETERLREAILTQAFRGEL